MRTLSVLVTLTFDHPIEDESRHEIYEHLTEAIEELYDNPGPALTLIDDISTQPYEGDDMETIT